MYDLYYIWNLKKQNKTKLTGTENRLVDARGKRWGQKKWMKGVKKKKKDKFFPI